jgi:hypothetical protein
MKILKNKNTFNKTTTKNIASLKKQKGSALALILGSIVVLGVIGYIGSTIYTSIIGGMQRTNLVVQTSQTITQAMYTLTTETTRNGSGIPVATPFFSAAPSPVGGGQIPASSAAPKSDSFGTVLGYCTNNAAIQSDPVFAVISAGSNKQFDTTCAQALTGVTIGDDKILMRTVANILQGVGGTVYFGDPVSQITTLGGLNPVKAGEFRVVTADGSAWTNKTGTPGQANWSLVGSAGGSSFADDIGLIVQASYPTFNVNNPKFLPADGSIYTSATYPTLATRASPSAVGGTTWTSITYGNGIFVAISTGTNIAATSPDGITWTVRTLPSVSTWNTITFGNGLFVVASNTNRAATSPDGITWTARTLNRTQTNVSSAYGNNTYLVVPSGSNILQYSGNGITWNSSPAVFAYTNFTDVTFGNGRFIITDNAGSDGVIITPDGINFTYSTILGLGRNWSAVAYGNGTFLAIASGSNTAATSPDGVTWTQQTLPATANWSNLTFGNGIFTAIATGTNIVAFSSDGITWVQKVMPVTTNWKNIAFNGSVFSVISNTPGTISATIGVTSTSFSVPNINSGNNNYYFIKALP